MKSEVFRVVKSADFSERQLCFVQYLFTRNKFVHFWWKSNWLREFQFLLKQETSVQNEEKKNIWTTVNVIVTLFIIIFE